MSPKKISYYLSIASEVAKASPDEQTKVGYVLAHRHTGAMISTAYNGFIRGGEDARLPKTRPSKYPYFIHSEVNLICNAARHGIATEGCIAFGTMSPCINCTRLLYQSGITSIYFKELYTDYKNNSEMEDLEILLTKHEDYYNINLSPRIKKHKKVDIKI